jgi:rhodanese-related sulfurtransferase
MGNCIQKLKEMLHRNILFFIRMTVVLSVIIIGVTNCKNIKQQDALEKEEQVSKEEISESQALPRLIVKNRGNRDLGKIREGIETSVTFTLLNTGEADALNISVHDLSMGGCTAVSHVSQLAVNDSAKLIFVFETLGYGGKKETREIKVRYDNPKLSPLTLSVTAEVLPTEAHQVTIGELYYNFFVLVDVRDEKSFQNGHIAGAINIPDEEVLSWASKLNKDFMIYLYSDNGEKSDILARKLRSNGFTEALSIIGGIEEWKGRYGERVIITGTK